MKRIITVACLVSAISLVSGVIWQEDALAAGMPDFASLRPFQEDFNPPARVVADAEGIVFIASELADAVSR